MGEDAGLLKTDELGIEQWYKEYKYGDYDDRTEGVCRTRDGGYILTGWGKDTSYDYWMIKTDEFGDEQWNKTYGSSGDDYCHTKDCYQTSDGGFIMGGFSSSYGAGGFDIWLAKTDSTGNMLWNKTYGGSNNDVCWGMESTDDGGYVVVATMNYDGFSGDKDDINLVKIDGAGNIVWVQEYAGPDRQIGTSVDKTSGGGFIVAGCNGRFHDPDSDGLIVKFAPFPQLDIEITGGLGAAGATITNNGLGDAIGVPYEISVTGGLLGLINKTINGMIDIEAGATESISSGLLLGLGGIEISVTVGVKEEIAEGMQLLILTIIQ